jgi:hypothetical protein
MGTRLCTVFPVGPCGIGDTGFETPRRVAV